MAKNFLLELQQMEIADLKGNTFKVENGFPQQKQLQKYRVTNTTPYYVKISDANLIIFQIIDLGFGYSIISDYSFSEESELICNINTKILELFTTLTGSIIFHLQNDKTRAANRGCFNLIAAPHVSNRVTVPRGHIRTLDAHMDRDYLQKLSIDYPILENILKADEQGGWASIYEEHGHFTLQAAELAFQLIRTVHENPMYRDQLKPIFEKWLDALLTPQGINVAKSKYTNGQIEAISHLITYIKEYTDRHLSINDLIEESNKVCGLTAKQIRESIKLITGKTPKKFIKECKMMEAKRLLDKGFSEKEIASQTGYDHLTHLERDFKIYFGISMKEYKSKLKSATH